MKSKDKMEVIVRKFDEYDKLWAIVKFRNGTEWVPSFEDLFRVIMAICHCEDEKYPPPGEGRFYVRRFLKDCCEPQKPGQDLEDRWQELVEKYKFKNRREQR